MSTLRFSRIEPVLESNLEALEHLFFDVFDVSELAPTSHITVFRRALNLYDRLFHQPKLVRVFFPEMLFANVSSLLALVNDCRDVSRSSDGNHIIAANILQDTMASRSTLPHPKASTRISEGSPKAS